MVRRRFNHLDRVSRRLSMRLNRLVNYLRSSGCTAIIKAQVLIQARLLLEEHFKYVLEYTWRTRVKRDLKNPVQLDVDDVEKLRTEVDRKMVDFGKILDDVCP